MSDGINLGAASYMGKPKKKQKRIVYFLDKSLEVKITYMKSWLNYQAFWLVVSYYLLEADV